MPTGEIRFTTLYGWWVMMKNEIQENNARFYKQNKEVLSFVNQEGKKLNVENSNISNEIHAYLTAVNHLNSLIQQQNEILKDSIITNNLKNYNTFFKRAQKVHLMRWFFIELFLPVVLGAYAVVFLAAILLIVT